MFRRKIPRHWVGSYSYTYGEGLPESMPKVDFGICIVVKAFGRFTGEVIEGDLGIPEPAKIIGKLTGNKIAFNKFYDSLWAVDENGESAAYKDADVPPIYYVGEFSEDRQSISGKWNTQEFYRPINDSMCKFEKVGGIWDAFAK